MTNYLPPTEPVDYLDSKILLVEDHPVTAQVMQKMLITFHCHVDLAMNGISAIQLAKQYYYDLILTDIGLPDISGPEIAQTISQFYSVPIIALTAHANEAIEATCLSAGIRLVLPKPLTYTLASHILNIFVAHRIKPEKLYVKEKMAFSLSPSLRYAPSEKRVSYQTSAYLTKVTDLPHH